MSGIEANVAGQEVVESGQAPMSDWVINLMEALEKSLKQAKPVNWRKAS